MPTERTRTTDRPGASTSSGSSREPSDVTRADTEVDPLASDPLESDLLGTEAPEATEATESAALGSAAGTAGGTREGRTTGRSGGLASRIGDRARRLFSPRAFLLALVLAVGGLLAANAVVPLPGAGLLGVFVATFAFGLAVEDRRYAETATAGGVAVGASVLLDLAVVAFLGGFGPSLALLAGAVGAAVAAIGTYFGRDLRDGLTRDL